MCSCIAVFKSMHSPKLKDSRSAAFMVYLKDLGYGKSSVSMLPKLLYDFLAFTGKTTPNITTEDIKNYYHYICNRPNKRNAGGLSESYIYHHIYAIKLFFAWQLENGILQESPISGLYFKSPTSAIRVILETNEVDQLYKATKTHLERAILNIYYGCGLRRSEGVDLNIGDVHFEKQLLYVRKGKGGTRRVIPMSINVKEGIERYVKVERKSKGQMALLLGHQGRRITGNRCNKTVKSLVERTGINKSISLHCLRHSIATHLLQNGLSLDYVSAFLGHKQLESTQVYTHIKKEQLWNL